MKIKSTLLLLLLVIFAAYQQGCRDPKDKSATFTLDFKAMHFDDFFVIGQTYVNAQDYKFKIETLRFYISNITLLTDDGNEVMVKDVDYLNFQNNHNTDNAQGEQITAKIPAGNYSALRFAVGVDSTLNFKDPSEYPSAHPLSIFNGSHWNWNTGYIFLKIEGNIDTVPYGSGSLDKAFLYHTGTLPLYREVQLNEGFTVPEDGSYLYPVRVDVNRFFYNDTDTMDVMNENFTHTIGAFHIAEKITNFFTNSFSKR